MLEQLFVVVLEFLTLQARQGAQLHLQNRVGLQLGQRKEGHHLGPCDLGSSGAADKRDDLVQKVKSDLQAFEDMRPCLRFVQLEECPANHHFAAVGQEVLQGIFEGQNTRLSVDQGQHVDAKTCPQGRVLEQEVQDFLRIGFALQGNDDLHTRAI